MSHTPDAQTSEQKAAATSTGSDTPSLSAEPSLLLALHPSQSLRQALALYVVLATRLAGSARVSAAIPPPPSKLALRPRPGLSRVLQRVGGDEAVHGCRSRLSESTDGSRLASDRRRTLFSPAPLPRSRRYATPKDAFFDPLPSRPYVRQARRRPRSALQPDLEARPRPNPTQNPEDPPAPAGAHRRWTLTQKDRRP
ncbi:hypothetical protein FKP32DRAFT_1762423 [Trametes sanguinea]|nr:hypothetical protein FKP32DRAFT_1762423 [Trametes sanguinea]